MANTTTAELRLLQKIQETGWDAVMNLKQNSRDLYQSAPSAYLRSGQPPEAARTAWQSQIRSIHHEYSPMRDAIQSREEPWRCSTCS